MGSTSGGAPINVVQASDSVGGAKNNRLNLTLDTYKCSILANIAAQKVPEWSSYGNFCKVTEKPHFLKKCKRGTKANFSKIAQKVTLAEKAKKHCGTNGIIL